MNNSHYQFPCVPAQQGRRVTIYLGSLRFADVWPRCTVTPREPRVDDPLYSSSPNTKIQTPQRSANDERLDTIADFVEERLNDGIGDRKEAIFPGTIILGLLASIENSSQPPDEPTPTAAILIETDPPILWLPKMDASLFIIDGQHRLKGLDRLHKRLIERIAILVRLQTRRTREQEDELKNAREIQQRLEDFQVPISLLVDFDLAEQAMVFASVNFNQKPVSRSFYYDIFGTFESDRVTPISFTHELVLHLNNSEKSPLHDMIKLLGSGPGLVSQAFVGTRLTLLIDPDHPKAVFADFFLRRQINTIEASRQFATIIRSFFAAVKDGMRYAWPVKNSESYSAYHYTYILCKSMGMSGLIAILGDIYRLSLLDFAYGREAEVAESGTFSCAFFSSLLRDFDPKGREDPALSEFARGQPWSIGGSAVVEKRIYIEMKKWLFSAYQIDVLTADSLYVKALNQWNGQRRAADLASDHNTTAESFWPKIEEMWQQLIRS